MFVSGDENLYRFKTISPTCSDSVMELVTMGNKVAIRAIIPQNSSDSTKRKQQCVILAVTVKYKIILQYASRK